MDQGQFFINGAEKAISHSLRRSWAGDGPCGRIPGSTAELYVITGEDDVGIEPEEILVRPDIGPIR